MFRRLYRFWIIIPLLILAVVAREWVEEPTVAELEATIDMAQTRTDYYLESFETRKLNADGQPEYTIIGDTLKHYPADDSSEIDQPRLTLHREDSVWTLNSNRGRLTTDPDIFTFEGDVFIQRDSTAPGEPGLSIKTRDVVVHTGTNQVETDQPIEVKSDSWTLTSTGLRSHIDSGTLSLLSNVKGHYEVDNSE